MDISSVCANTIGAKTQNALALLSLTIDNRYSEQRTTPICDYYKISKALICLGIGEVLVTAFPHP
jgi:hypothetical protein